MEEGTTTAEELTTRFRDLLSELMFVDDVDEFGLEDMELEQVSTFEEDGVLTSNQGLVLRTTDGSEFQVTVVRSR